MILGLILIILLHTCQCARSTCSPKSHTEAYLKNKNTLTSLFYPIARQVTNLCEPITNTAFRKEYPWLTSADEVEHIIDINNSPGELENCNKRIRGNMIIANGQWNRQVGQLCWKDVSVEKKLVYGDEIYNSAYNSVLSCCQIAPKIGDVVGVIIVIVVVLTLFVAALLIINSYVRSTQVNTM
jgi:hypothetical protein